jgi:hypothetical protein
MKKSIVIWSLLLSGIFSVALHAQPEKLRIAVMDPSSAGNLIDEGMVVAAREIIGSALVNTGKYNIVERSLIDKIMKEQKFSNSGAIDAGSASELGKLTGAGKVLLSVLTSAGNRALLSLKMVDVESASVEMQKIKAINPDEFLDVIEPLTLELIGEVAAKSEPKKSGGGGGIGGLLGKGLASLTGSNKSDKEEEKPSEETEKPKTPKEKFVERNQEEVWFESSSATEGGNNVLFEFRGIPNSKNPAVDLYLNGKKIGGGTLHEGFSIKIADPNPGAYTLDVKWSDMIRSTSFNINTRSKNHYEFEYKKGGFGYIFKLKD